MSETADQHDHRRRRCPKLGHEIAFAYCRLTDGQGLCRKVLDCWFEVFDVEAFLRGAVGDEPVDALADPPKDKAVSLYELIRQAQQRAGSGPS